jgi:hypothetical protein
LSLIYLCLSFENDEHAIAIADFYQIISDGEVKCISVNETFNDEKENSC